MTQEKVIDIIKKLLERTEANGCTPAEAATAASQVAILLAKHNLSMSEITAEEVELIKEDFLDTKSCNEYQAIIASELGKHFGVSIFCSTCKEIVKGHIYKMHTYTTLRVYGEKIKVQAFKEVFRFIYNAYQQSWTKYHKTLNIGSHEKSLMRRSYVCGFIDGVTNEIIKEENANALVVSKSQAVQDWESANLKENHSFSTQAIHNAYANRQGYEDGAFAQRNKNKVITD